MLTVYSDRHRLHHGHAELIDGKMMPCFEMPRRADMVIARVREVGLGDVIEPQAFGLDLVKRVHDPGFVEFLAKAWADWSAEGRTNDALPLVWPVPGLRHDRVPEGIDGRLGYYSMDAGVPITAGTWDAVQSRGAGSEKGRYVTLGTRLIRPKCVLSSRRAGARRPSPRC